MPVKTNTNSVFDDNGNKLSDLLRGNGSKIIPRIYPEDFGGNTLGEKVMSAMDFVKKSNGGFEVFFGKDNTEYVVSSAIEIPSNTTIRLENCTLRMADNIVDNLFRSANIIPDPDNPKGHCLNNQDVEWLENIKIIGKDATIVMENNASQSGALTVGWRGTTFCLVGINGFEISGLNIQKNLSWSVNIVDCCNGSIHDLTFNTIRENGDGIDLLKCHDISIYNIGGTTQDDTIAICSCDSARYDERPAERTIPIVPIKYDYNKFGSDTYSIFVKNVHANGTNHVLILITGTHEVYNITASDLSDTYNNVSGKNAIVKIYGGQYNGDYHHGLIHNCCITNIVANNCSTAAVWLSEGLIQHGIIHNIIVPSGRTVLNNQSGANLQDYDMVVN